MILRIQRTASNVAAEFFNRVHPHGRRIFAKLAKKNNCLPLFPALINAFALLCSWATALLVLCILKSANLGERRSNKGKY